MLCAEFFFVLEYHQLNINPIELLYIETKQPFLHLNDQDPNCLIFSVV
ncbi:MAG: hypothetical protein ACI920_004128, partial [Saprospiraceae bacterium]